MADHIQADQCPICGSPVFVKMVPPSEPLPDPVYSCRCRLVYPERFRVAGQHGYGKTARRAARR